MHETNQKRLKLSGVINVFIPKSYHKKYLIRMGTINKAKLTCISSITYKLQPYHSHFSLPPKFDQTNNHGNKKLALLP